MSTTVAVFVNPVQKSTAHYDVVVLGGTLGVLLATALLSKEAASAWSSSGPEPSSALQLDRKLRVAVVERGLLVGRTQEWNCTAADLQVLVDTGVLDAGEVSQVLVTRIPAVRMGVAGLADIHLTGVMDAGVSPKALLEVVKRRFVALGGHLLEQTAFQHLHVYEDCAQLELQQPCGGMQQLTAGQTAEPASSQAAGGAGARQATFDSHTAADAASHHAVTTLVSADVVVDALGSFSPLSQQARGAALPEAAMLLVGSCVETPAAASGGADVLWGMEPIDRLSCQQFWWERFPADGGASLTSYMFTFTDPSPDNKDLLPKMMQYYTQHLDEYLGAATESLSVRFGVFGYVPCYNQRVIPVVDRLLPVGDSAANRSALSLAGFCAMLRQLGRLTQGLREALHSGAITRQELSLLQPWCPGVTVTTGMQRTMSVYSSQFSKVRAAAGGAAGHTDHTTTTKACDSTQKDLSAAVLSIMGASLNAMWDAVGEEGVRPFVADRIQLAPLAASIAAQLRCDLKQLLAYSMFLGDSRGASRLMAGLAGLWLYGLLHKCTPATTPLHETLLAASPRLLYRWHRYADAWKYGSGSDWSSASEAETPSSNVPSTSSCCIRSSGRGADAGAAGCAAGSPLHHQPSLFRDGLTVANWGRLAPSPTQRSNRVTRGCVIVCATPAGGGGAGAGAGDQERELSWHPDDVEALLDGRLDRCDLVNSFCWAAITQQGRPRENVYSFTEPAEDTTNAGSNKAPGAASSTTFPAWCNPMQSMDSHEVIDWSDIENDGWGAAAKDQQTSSSGSAVQTSGVGEGHGDSTGDGGSNNNRLRPPAAAAAAVSCSSASSRQVHISMSSLPMVYPVGRGCSWGKRVQRPALASPFASSGSPTARSVLARATPSSDPVPSARQAGEEADDDTSSYEGADGDALFRQGSLEMDDPGHPTDVAATNKGSSKPAHPTAKPYMNIKDGKWIPPSKAEAEMMMQQLSQMGPDEGV